MDNPTEEVVEPSDWGSRATLAIERIVLDHPSAIGSGLYLLDVGPNPDVLAEITNLLAFDPPVTIDEINEISAALGVRSDIQTNSYRVVRGANGQVEDLAKLTVVINNSTIENVLTVENVGVWMQADADFDDQPRLAGAEAIVRAAIDLAKKTRFSETTCTLSTSDPRLGAELHNVTGALVNDPMEMDPDKMPPLAKAAMEEVRAAFANLRRVIELSAPVREQLADVAQAESAAAEAALANEETRLDHLLEQAFSPEQMEWCAKLLRQFEDDPAPLVRLVEIGEQVLDSAGSSPNYQALVWFDELG